MANNACWTIEDAAKLYQVGRWGQSLFSIDESGDLVVQVGPSAGERWKLVDIVNECTGQSANAPLLIRFLPIIRHRLSEMYQAFGQAINEYQYDGDYQCVYPIKVNQHHEVIEAFVASAKLIGGGLEAGSKAELMAIIAVADNQMPLICNGFKDPGMIEMALRATAIGRNLTMIIEKPSEIPLIAKVSKHLGVMPRLGLRVKLAARSSGRWQSSVGSSSKFGLTSQELEHAIELLRQHHLLNVCRLLHFHPGSQITNIRKIKACIIEATRIYAALVRQNIPLETIDVGGGLAVDYTGRNTTDASSKNYHLQEYANDVVYYIHRVCTQEKVPHPNIISESGRALMAHHSVLVVPVLHATAPAEASNRSDQQTDSVPQQAEQFALTTNSPNAEKLELPLIELHEIIKELDQGNVHECYHDAQQALEMAQQLFINGHMTLEHRTIGESLFSQVCYHINGFLNDMEFVPPELAELKTMFAATYLANFSVFQALPDHWAIHQLFPVLPIHRLDERPDRMAVIGDITCDSDGKIERYVQNQGDMALPLHVLKPGEPYWLGIFLVGAYQEALSDDHNLFGKFHTVNVTAGSDWRQRLRIIPGSTLTEVLNHVHHDVDELLGEIELATQAACEQGRLTPGQAERTAEFFQKYAIQYTYLDPAESDLGDERASPLSVPRSKASIQLRHSASAGH